MTVDSQVKNCYFTIKQSKATLKQLSIKTSDSESKQAFQSAIPLLSHIQTDLEKQLLFLAKEETQYE